MSSVITPRPALGSGMELLSSALTVPYAAGMRLDTIVLADDATLAVARPSREPLLLARLRRPLADEAILVVATVDGAQQPAAVFAPFSAAGTLLALFRPALPDGSEIAGPFAATLAVHLVGDERRDDALPDFAAPLPAAIARELVEGAVLEGRFARLLYLTTLEKQRAIRHGREIAAARHLALARAGGLDERGRALGVPRRRDPREPDDDYRGRLEIYSRWRLPTPAGFADALNGPGDPGSVNAGLPARARVVPRLRIVEETNELSIATKVVAVGDEGAVQRDRFQDLLRGTYLFDLNRPTSPRLPAARRERYEAMRRFLNEHVQPQGIADVRFSPLVATTLYRVVRLAIELGHGGEIFVAGAHGSPGARHELGLGVDLGPFKAHMLERMAEGVVRLAATGGELGALAASLRPRPVDDDPLGRWLLEPCGMRTVHPIDDILHLSPLPTQGQWIDGPDQLDVGATAQYEARYHASGAGTGIHVRVSEALAAASAAFAARGLRELPGALAAAQLRPALDAIAAAPTGVGPLLEAAVDAGLVAADGATLAASIVRVLNLDQVVAFGVGEAELTDRFASPAGARDGLLAWVEAFTDAGFYSVRGVWDATGPEPRLLVLCSVSQLPGASIRVGVPPPATFYWYEARLPARAPGVGDPLQLVQSRGGRATVVAHEPGLALLVSIGYVRRGLADPFEVRIELADAGARLSRDQYGYIMNLLEFLCPIGIEINTFDIRRHHVDADGEGGPEFLTSRASRTYHRDRHRRPFGSGQGRETRGATP